MPNLSNLPKSEDVEFWGDGEHMVHTPRPIAICQTHGLDNWTAHEGYTQESSIITCTKCPWGTQVPGYYKVKEGKIVDLRNL